MATMNVSLPDPMKDWVETRTQGGTYSNASDYVRHLIRQDQERVTAIAEMQSAIDAGLASGDARAFDASDFKARMRAQHG
jgi:antitoxin ParD1/3/4